MAKANINTAITGCTAAQQSGMPQFVAQTREGSGSEKGGGEAEAAQAMPSSAINANRIKINFVALPKISRRKLWRQVAKGAKGRELRAERIMPSSRRGEEGGVPQLLS